MRIREAALEKPKEVQRTLMIRSNKPEIIRLIKEERELTQEELDYLRYIDGT